MKTVKFQVPDSLWEKFYRAFPGHGERSTLLRKIIRHIIINKPQHTFFDEKIGARVLEDLEEEEDSPDE